MLDERRPPEMDEDNPKVMVAIPIRSNRQAMSKAAVRAKVLSCHQRDRNLSVD